MSWTKPVYSERAQEVSYDDETQEMVVVWKNGKRTAYAGVPEELAVELANAPSVGSMINASFTGRFPHRNF